MRETEPHNEQGKTSREDQAEHIAANDMRPILAHDFEIK
jgi:hypothetical protein